MAAVQSRMSQDRSGVRQDLEAEGPQRTAVGDTALRQAEDTRTAGAGRPHSIAGEARTAIAR